MEGQDEMLTVEEVAGELKMKPRQIREAINKKELRAVRVGDGPRGAFRIERKDLNAWLKSRETKPEELPLAG